MDAEGTADRADGVFLAGTGFVSGVLVARAVLPLDIDSGRLGWQT